MTVPTQLFPRVLQWLVRPKALRELCYIVATPDPRHSRGWSPVGKSYCEYYVRFGSGPGIERDNYHSHNPNFMYAYNYGSQRAPVKYHPERLESEMSMEEIIEQMRMVNPSVGIAINYDSPEERLESEEIFRKLQAQTPSPSEYPERTDWARIIDTDIKGPAGQDVGKVLVEMIKGFPKYDLESDEGIYKAIEDMEVKLGQVAHFEEPA